MSLRNSDSTNNKKSPLLTSESRIGKLTREFCKSTSLHGFGFLYNAKTVAERLVWILAIVAMMGVSVFFLILNTNAYLKSGLNTNIESSTADLSVSAALKSTAD